jgi:Spy/CpxP family protein refolding chaperone
MSKTIKLQLIILSAAFNLAFVGMWIAYGRSESPAAEPICMPVGCDNTGTGAGEINCLLHRQLKVDEKQWTVIAAPLENFRQGCQMVGGDVKKLRSELIDLLAATEVDHAAIEAKQQEVLACQGRMQGMIIKQLLAEKDVLTTEQQKQLFALLRQNTDLQE